VVTAPTATKGHSFGILCIFLRNLPLPLQIPGTHPPKAESGTEDHECIMKEALWRLPVDLSRIVRAKRQGKKSAQVAVELGIPVEAVYEGTRKARALLKVEVQAYLSA